MKKIDLLIFAVLGGVCVIVFVVAASQRLSPESMAVIAGGLCGLAASIPVSLGLVVIVTKNWKGEDELHQRS